MDPTPVVILAEPPPPPAEILHFPKWCPCGRPLQVVRHSYFCPRC